MPAMPFSARIANRDCRLMAKVPDIPANCGVCIYYFKPDAATETRRCHRHSPAPGREENELTEWPNVTANQRCGQGSLGNDPARAFVRCEACTHWFWPQGGVPYDGPTAGNWWGSADDRGQAWWRGAGLCLSRAPTPGVEIGDEPTHWKVTHFSHGCGDGAPVESSDSGARSPLALADGSTPAS